MNFLELVQQYVAESGATGQPPASVLNQTGEHAKTVNRIKLAWLSIQLSRRTWRWMRATTPAIATIEGTNAYAASAFSLSRWARWVAPTFRMYETAAGNASEWSLVPLVYEEFRAMFLVGPQVNARPSYVSVSPAGALLLGPAPDATGYTLYGDYFKSAQTLVQDADKPECPEDFHWAIVWRALMRYAASEGDPALYDDAKNNFEEFMHRLEVDQLETPTLFDETLVE